MAFSSIHHTHQAFAEFLNRDVGNFKNADRICGFCHHILKGSEEMGDAEVEECLAEVVQLVSYLMDKDLFADIYRNQLARRLLNSRSASDDMERLMIGESGDEDNEEEEEDAGFVFFLGFSSVSYSCWGSGILL